MTWLLRLFRPRRKPLQLHKLPFKTHVGVFRIAMLINDTTRSTGKYGLEHR
jgi:hypothetical protein